MDSNSMTLATGTAKAKKWNKKSENEKNQH